MRTPAALVISAALLALGASAASAATLTVDTLSDPPIAADGVCSVREAIAAVDSPPGTGDCGVAGGATNTIVLRAGHYVLTIGPVAGDDNSTGDLDISGLTTSVTISGAGASQTTIDATGLGDRVLSVSSSAPTVTVEQLTITGGHAPDGAPGVNGQYDGFHDPPPTGGGDGQFGGGIENLGTLTVRDAAITANHAGNGGHGGDSHNVNFQATGGAGGAGELGGGIYNTGTLAVIDSSITDNRGGDGGAGGKGGGAAINPEGPGGPGGTGNGDGGGIDNVGGSVTITGSTIAGNRGGDGGAGGPGGYGANGGNAGSGSWGGAINNLSGTLTITNSTIQGNVAGSGGAGGAGGGGSGVDGAGGDGGNGGGIRNSGTATLTSDTVSDNLAGVPGGAGNPGTGNGILSFSPVATTLQNSIVVQNGRANCAGPIVDGGHDMTADASCPGAIADPLLGPLQSNGGPTQTMALGAGSPAIDQVPAIGAGCPATDQRGVARPQFAACDIGAFELAPAPVVVVSPPVISVPSLPALVATPVLSALKLSPTKFHAASKGGSTTPSAKKPKTGTTISYRDSVAAKTTLTVTRTTTGAKVGKTCRPRTSKTSKKAKKCSLVRTLGHLSHTDKAGADSVHFSGRLSGKKLAKGAYSLVITAKLGTRPSKPATKHFTIT